MKTLEQIATERRAEQVRVADPKSVPRHIRTRILHTSSITREWLEKLLEMAQKERILIEGFGVFFVAERRERRVLNPITKEPMKIPKSRELRFHPATAVRRKLNPR